ncbi:Protein ced-11 [Bienertia sinuspersici]
MDSNKEHGASYASREETTTHKKNGARDPLVPRTSDQEWEATLAKVELIVGDLRDDSAKLIKVKETMEELEGKFDRIRSQSMTYATSGTIDTKASGSRMTRKKLNGNITTLELRMQIMEWKGLSPNRSPRRTILMDINAMIATMDENESKNEARMRAMHLEGEAKLANMRNLNTSVVVEKEPTRQVNEASTRLLVDTGVSYNLLQRREAKDLWGMGCSFPLREVEGKIDFLIVDIDDEYVVLSLEFLTKVRSFKVNNRMLTITSKGSEIGMKLAQCKEQDVRVSIMKA